MLIADWLPDAWARTRTLRVLHGGLNGGPLAHRRLLVELADQARLARARDLTTTGRFTGDICRCPGSLTLALYDGEDAVVGSATLHGHGSVSWERSRFANDLDVAQPTALTLFLSACGVTGILVTLFTELAIALGYYERPGTPQFRPARRPVLLADRQVPQVLRDELVGISGDIAGDLPQVRVRALARQLADAEPDPVARAVALLNWLGRLPYPTEALWGEGALVRRLLATLPEPYILAAAATDDPAVALGALNWAVHQPDDRTVATVIGPTLRRLLP